MRWLAAALIIAASAKVLGHFFQWAQQLTSAPAMVTINPEHRQRRLTTFSPPSVFDWRGVPADSQQLLHDFTASLRY